VRFRLEPVAPLVGVEVEVILHHVAEGIANAAVAEGVVNRVHLVARGSRRVSPCRRWCSVTRGDLCRFDLLPDLPSSIRRLTVYMASQCRQGDQVPGDDQTQLDGQRIWVRSVSLQRAMPTKLTVARPTSAPLSGLSMSESRTVKLNSIAPSTQSGADSLSRSVKSGIRAECLRAATYFAAPTRIGSCKSTEGVG